MTTPPSPLFTTVSLAHAFNASRSDLPERLHPPPRYGTTYGQQTIRARRGPLPPPPLHDPAEPHEH